MSDAELAANVAKGRVLKAESDLKTAAHTMKLKVARPIRFASARSNVSRSI
jgi:hypothetical protein